MLVLILCFRHDLIEVSVQTHTSAKFECEAALELLPECVTANSLVSRDVATEYVKLLRHYRTFLKQRAWAIRARMVTNLIRDIEEGSGIQRTAA